MEKNLTVGGIINESIQIALKNVASILGAVVLWIVTIWIPYLNVGTTIAIITMPIELSKGNIMSPTAIFDAKYRKYMGEFFILGGLMGMAISVAAIFFFIPAIVIGIAWSLAFYLLIDKEMDPMQALAKSNEATYGYKWKIFFGKLVLILIPYIVVLIGAAINVKVLSPILMLIGIVFLVPMYLAADAVIYKILVLGNEEGSSTESSEEQVE